MAIIEFDMNYSEQPAFLFFFIITVLAVWLILFVFSLKIHGFKKTIRYFFPMIFISLFLETSALSKGNFYYPGYFMYISILGGSVPIIILLGWSVNLFLFTNIGEHVISKFYNKKNFIQIVIISLIAGLFALLLDLLQDPIAHHNGWWVWNKSMAFVKFFDVPLSNFMGWFLIISGMCLLTLIIDRSAFSENRKLAISFSIIPIVFIPIVIYFNYLT